MLKTQRRKRKIRIRSKIEGTSDVPRLAVFRSNRFTYAQVFDDQKGKTLASASSKSLDIKGNKSDLAEEVGKSIGNLVKKLKIEKVVFDRAGYAYHGRIKRLAEGARSTGLKF